MENVFFLVGVDMEEMSWDQKILCWLLGAALIVMPALHWNVVPFCAKLMHFVKKMGK